VRKSLCSKGLRRLNYLVYFLENLRFSWISLDKLDDIDYNESMLKRKENNMDIYNWMLANEELTMFVIIPALLIPVVYVVEKVTKNFENNQDCS